jgi:hypothetical protein
MTKKPGKFAETPHWPSYARALKRETKKLDKSKADEFKDLKKRALAIEDPYYAAMALSWIGLKMIEVGLKSEGVFSSALERSRSVEPEWRRAEILLQVTAEMSKTSTGDLQELFDAVRGINDSEIREKTLNSIRGRLLRKGFDLTEIKTKTSPMKNPRKKGHLGNVERKKIQTWDEKMKSTIILGLVNTYAGKTLKDTHIRAVARAAPLCIAYNLKLALFNFPVADPAILIKLVENQTQISETRKHISALYERGWLKVRKLPKEPVLPDLGLLVATTSKPDSEKALPLEKMLETKKPICFLMGLGSSGLPKNILKLAKYHLELTGKNVSLETCTALGVLAASLGSFKNQMA